MAERKTYKFTSDEIYPVYHRDEDIGHEGELTDEEIARYESAMKEFYDVQNLIKRRIKERNG